MEPDWQVYIRDTAKFILSEQSPKKLMDVRSRLYELLVHGIPTEIIFKVSISFFVTVALKKEKKMQFGFFF